MTKINKEGWENIKLGEVITEYSKKNKADDDIPVYSVTNSAGFCREYFSKEVASQDKSTYKIVPYGCFAYNPSRINVGSIGLQEEEERVIVSPLYNVFSTSERIDNHFLLYFLKSKVALQIINAKATGSVRMNLRINMLKGFDFNLPPLPIQQRIVEELDEINAIISAKKQQLSKLDELAQSIFYDMFGDPVANEKGWEVYQLGVVSPLLNGRAYKQNELLDKGKYKVLRVGNFFTNGNYYYSDLELPEDKYCDNGDLLFAWSASFGARIWDGEKVIYHYHIWKVNYDSSLINKWFYLYLLNTITSALMNDAHGIGMIHLTKGGMEEKRIPLPPLPLQETFAARVSAIEEQKAAIAASIEKMQTLLDARMQEYFG